MPEHTQNLPVEPKRDSTAQKIPAPAPAPTCHLLRILIVDDNALNRTLAARLAERLGHTSILCRGGKEALDILQQDPIDLVLMDVQMPEIDGVETTRRIREQELSTGRHLPIIALTARTNAGDRETFLANGMDDYLAKPLSQLALQKALQRVLDGSSHPSSASATLPSAGPLPASAAQAEKPLEPMERLVEDFQHDRALVKKLAALFLETTPKLMSDIRQAVAQGDTTRLERAAHTLKGSLGQIQAIGAYESAFALEALGHKHDLTNAAALSLRLETQLEAVNATMRQWLEAS